MRRNYFSPVQPYIVALALVVATTLFTHRLRPWQNGYAESFHSKVRDEFLNSEEFESQPQARALGAL